MTSGASDRRHYRRAGIGEHGITAARVRPGHLVAVIDVSAGGVSIEISQRLLPGAAVDLQFDTPHRRTSLRGRVLRCIVTGLRPSKRTFSGCGFASLQDVLILVLLRAQITEGGMEPVLIVDAVDECGKYSATSAKVPNALG